jgi:hypothetical protein
MCHNCARAAPQQQSGVFVSFFCAAKNDLDAVGHNFQEFTLHLDTELFMRPRRATTTSFPFDPMQGKLAASLWLWGDFSLPPAACSARLTFFTFLCVLSSAYNLGFLRNFEKLFLLSVVAQNNSKHEECNIALRVDRLGLLCHGSIRGTKHCGHVVDHWQPCFPLLLVSRAPSFVPTLYARGRRKGSCQPFP